MLNNADLQYLLNQLISGGGSLSQFENTSAASTDAAAPLIPALASSLEVVDPSPVSSPATDDASTATVTSSDTTAASNPPIGRNDAARVLSVADTSDKASTEKHTSSLATRSGCNNARTRLARLCRSLLRSARSFHVAPFPLATLAK